MADRQDGRPGKVQYAIKGVLPKRLQDELLFRWYAGGRNWKQHRAFAVPNNDSVGAIRVNVRGRDRFGVVEPGAEYEQVCRDIADALQELVDPETGRKVVSRVTLTPRGVRRPAPRRPARHHGAVGSVLPVEQRAVPASPGRCASKGRTAGAGSHTPRGFVLVPGRVSRPA